MKPEKKDFSYCFQLQAIDEEAFDITSIESITILSEVTDHKEGLCNGAAKLKKVKVSSSNPRYYCLEERMNIGKETLKSNNYETSKLPQFKIISFNEIQNHIIQAPNQKY